MKTLLIIVASITFFSSFSFFADSAPRNYKDWKYACEDQRGEDTFCSIQQLITENSSSTPILLVAIAYPDNHAEPSAIFTLPLGVRLNTGVSLSVDGNKSLTLNYNVCDTVGCRVTMKLEENWLGQFKAGNKAILRFTSPEFKEIGVPISLRGFTAAIKALREP